MCIWISNNNRSGVASIQITFFKQYWYDNLANTNSCYCLFVDKIMQIMWKWLVNFFGSWTIYPCGISIITALQTHGIKLCKAFILRPLPEQQKHHRLQTVHICDLLTTSLMLYSMLWYQPSPLTMSRVVLTAQFANEPTRGESSHEEGW